MRDLLIDLKPLAQISRQSQIRERIVTAILSGQIPPGERMPSSRRLASDIGVARNTITIVYQSLLDDGYLVARERSGYFVSETVLEDFAEARERTNQSSSETAIDWDDRFRIRPNAQPNIAKPSNWSDYPYPFIYGQVDKDLVPISAWRECTRQALGLKWLDAWTSDVQNLDDDMLIDQIRTRLLPRRGIIASADEIMVTMGAQQALYILASLLTKPETTIGLENPGYPDTRNIFTLRTGRIVPIPLDREGAVVGEQMNTCDLIVVTPSHQAPTTVTMSPRRRSELLDLAQQRDIAIIEDDYEFETNFSGKPHPALKSSDTDGRVIYVGSLSKVLFPGLRLGYVVAPKKVIDEARALRRLMLRHPPSNNQRTTALFLALGYHDRLIAKLRRVYGERWRLIMSELEARFPDFRAGKSTGGTSIWIEGPEELNARRLAELARAHGVLIEPGHIYFAGDTPPDNMFRLGFSSIPYERIQPGLDKLSEAYDALKAEIGKSD